MRTERISEETALHHVDAKKPTKWKFRNCAVLAISVGLLVVISFLILIFFVKDFWKQIPQKVYDVEYKFFNDGERTTVWMEIDPGNKIETFQTENGTERTLEIHDFKHGITGIYFAGLQKCFIKRQTKEIPAMAETKMVETEEDEITTTFYEQSMFWVPLEEPIKDKEFLKNSKIFEICENASIHWIYPSTPTAPEFQDFEDAEDDDPVLVRKEFWPKEETDKKQRRSRSLTEHDLPVNDYREAGIELDPMLDHRGYCCSHCRRGQRYCRRVCEPLHGFYPYPYCYESGRVICRIIMPCNWWIARMLGRV